ncbi:Imm15 family immunity protein [Pseudomonas cremoricolorata]|uniref:Imm15 family immunity protein n=1 Tax=Pseudomonas cremoricolorata TaxID=157783 RepID=UPI0012B5A295|nr:Imm15 family immunity protein [Pseudomonas cremoricolorata]
MTDIYGAFNETFEGEPWCDLSIFYDEYDPFEEIPLVSRYSRLVRVKKKLKIEDAASFLVGTAFFILSMAISMKREDEAKRGDRFFAITFTEFNFEDTEEPPIPNFFIYSGETTKQFFDRLKTRNSLTESTELKSTKTLFAGCHLSKIFDFYESRFFDQACGEELVRVYAVLR